MRVRPGFMPVAKVAHATGDSEGVVVPSAANVPSSASRARCGSSPASIRVATTSGSAPSNPRTSSRSSAPALAAARSPSAKPTRLTIAGNLPR